MKLDCKYIVYIGFVRHFIGIIHMAISVLPINLFLLADKNKLIVRFLFDEHLIIVDCQFLECQYKVCS